MLGDFDLLLPFDTNDPEFARGFEAGRIWTLLQETDQREFTVHATNMEIMARFAETLDLLPVASEEPVGSSTWVHVTFAAEMTEQTGGEC